jgi:suppressor of tumorigenicity protein 13
MACPLSPDDISKLKMFIGFATQQPEILNIPQLSFFKTFVEKMGGKIPEGNSFDPKRLVEIINIRLHKIH